jgi:excisionase family DNA binding protein
VSDLSFEEAARELGVSEAELEKLVADGKINAVKDGDSLSFKRSAIDNYSSQGGGDDAQILLSDDEIDLLGDDDIDFGIEIGGSDSETTPAAADLGGSSDAIELSLDDDLPEIDLGGGGGGDETVLDLEDMLAADSESTTPIPGGDLGDNLDLGGGLGDETLLDTDILDLGEDDADTFELDTTEDTLIDPTEEGTLLRGGGARVMQMKRRKSHAAWTAMLALGTLLMLVPLAVLLSTVYIDLRVGEIAADEGRAQHDWIKKYGGYLRGAVDGLADLFEKK